MSKKTIVRPSHNISLIFNDDNVVDKVIITATDYTFDLADVESDVNLITFLMKSPSSHLCESVNVIVDLAACVGYHAFNRFCKITVTSGRCNLFSDVQLYQCDRSTWDIQADYFAIPGNASAIFSDDELHDIASNCEWNYFNKDQRPQPNKLINVEIVYPSGDICTVGQAKYDNVTQHLVFDDNDASDTFETKQNETDKFFVRWQYVN